MGHTPGPWFCHCVTAVAEESDGEFGDATCITTIGEDEYTKVGHRGDLLAWVPHDRRHEANARLIAAAPELLAALKRLLPLWEESIGWEEDYMDMADDARAAIAKAEGRSE